jgi:hypothetical protein
MSDAIVGVLIGAGATLAGAMVQLWFSTRQRERERYMQLRRDVYLSAAEGLAASVEYLNQHARTDIPFGKAVTPSGMVAWLFKTYLIADTDALIALNEASTLIAAAIVDMAPYRLAVQQVEDDIAIARTGIESTQRFLDEMRSDIKNADMQNPTETTLRRVEWAAAQHDAATEQLQEQLHKLDTLTDEHARGVKQLIEKSIVINRDVQKPVRDALLAARAELEVEVDRSKFASAAAAWDARASAKVAQLIALIDEQVATPPPDLIGTENSSVGRDRTSEP